MPALLIRHRVADYATWAREFDEHEAIRWSCGCRGRTIFQNTADPGELVILLIWDDLLRARLYAQSDELQESLKRAGVTDTPDLWLLDQPADPAS